MAAVSVVRNPLKDLEAQQYSWLQEQATQALKQDKNKWAEDERVVLGFIATREANQVPANDALLRVITKLRQISMPTIVRGRSVVALSTPPSSAAPVINTELSMYLTDTYLFEILIEKLTVALRNGTLNGIDGILAGQIKGANTLRQEQSLEVGIISCFGASTLDRLIGPEVLAAETAMAKAAAKVATKAMMIEAAAAVHEKESEITITGTTLINRLVNKLMNPPRSVQNRPPGTTSPSRRHSTSEPPPVPNPEPFLPIKRRAMSVVSVNTSSEFPSELCDPAQRKKLIECALYLQFLFPGARNNFFESITNPESILLALIRFDLFMSYHPNYPVEVALGLFLSSSNSIDLTELKGICTLLLSGTLPTNVESPDPPPLPLFFNHPPYSDDSIENYIRKLVSIRFLNPDTFFKYPKAERVVAKSLLYAAAIHNKLRMSFLRALILTLPPEGIDESAAETLLKRVSPEPSTFSEEADKQERREINALLKGNNFFLREDLFELYLDNMFEMSRDSIPSYGNDAETASRLLIVVSRNEPILLMDALSQSFTPASLRQLYNSTDGAQNIAQLQSSLDLFAPRLPDHPCFDSKESFSALVTEADECAPQDANTEKVRRELLLTKKDMESDPSKDYETASLHRFNRLKLRTLFCLANDIPQSDDTNEGLFIECVNKILKLPVNRVNAVEP